jgi:hypothetical protein
MLSGMRTQTAASAAPDRAADRPPILSALHVLGFSYAEVGRLLGITTMSVHEWATNRRPIPLVRHLALQFVVTRLVGIVGAKHPPQTRYARRSQIAVEAATKWAQLSRDELAEDTGGAYRAEDIERGIALGERVIARLEVQ